jgi:hypothetical protein
LLLFCPNEVLRNDRCKETTIKRQWYITPITRIPYVTYFEIRSYWCTCKSRTLTFLLYQIIASHVHHTKITTQYPNEDKDRSVALGGKHWTVQCMQLISSRIYFLHKNHINHVWLATGTAVPIDMLIFDREFCFL